MTARRNVGYVFIACFSLFFPPLSFAGPAEELGVKDITLYPAPGWFERPDASGRVTVLNLEDGVAIGGPDSDVTFLTISVRNLRCRGPVFSIDQTDEEPYRNYELQINDLAILSFNPECTYTSGVGGSYSTRILIEESLAHFDTDEVMTLKIVLQPDDVVALVGQDDF